MNRRIIAFVAVAILVIPAVASAQYYTTLARAETTSPRTSKAGVYFGFSDPFLTLTGQYRTGLGPKMDVSLRPAIYFIDGGGTRFGAVGDLRFQLLGEREPLDLSLGPKGAISFGEDVTVFFIGGTICLGTDLATRGRMIVSPYGSVDLGYEHISVDVPGDGSDGDFEVHGAVGVVLQFNRNVSMPIELTLDDEIGIIGGVTYSF